MTTIVKVTKFFFAYTGKRYPVAYSSMILHFPPPPYIRKQPKILLLMLLGENQFLKIEMKNEVYFSNGQ